MEKVRQNSLMPARFAAALAFAILTLSGRANTEWIGSAATNDWNDAANWSGSDGSYRVNYAEMNGSPVTIAFTDMVDVRKGIWIENKLSGAVTFTAGSQSCGIAQASSGDFNLNVGTAADSANYSGALTIDGGAYHFANDIKVGIGTWRNDAYGEMTLKSGRVEVAYWMSLGITSNEGHTGETGVLNIEGGDFIVGYRDGAEAEGNSRVTLGASKLSHGIVNQYGGTLSSVANGNAHAYYDALILGGGESATGVYNMTGGSYTARKGDVLLGAGTGSAGSLNISGGSFTMATGWFKVATGTSSTGTVYVAGGVLAPQGEIWIGSGANSVATLNVAGGLVTNNSYMVLGRTSGGYDAKLLVTGGEVVNNGTTTIGSMAGNGGTALLSMDSGRYTAIGNVFIGEGCEVDSAALSGSATLTVNGGVFDNGSATTTLAVSSNLTGSDYSSALNLYGGRYITKAIEYGSGSTPAKVNLDGGTLEAAQSGEIFSSSANLTVNLGSNGATIDTGTNTVTISRSIAGSGTLTKAGSGELVFSVDPDFTGAIDVQEGTVTLPLTATSIECAGDTMKKTTSTGIVFYYSKEDNHWNAGGGSDTAWSTAANWDTAYEGGGNYVFRQNELNNIAATAGFTGETSLKAGLWIENGAEEANAITFTGDGTASLKIGKGGDADQGLNVGTWLAGGYLKVENLAIQSCQDLDIGNWGVGGHLIVGSGATVTTLGASGEAKWVILGVEGAANNSSITIEDGGVLEAWHIQRYTTAGSSTINMNGGTLRALATEQLVGDYWSQGRCATILFNSESTIDTQNHDVRIEAPVAGLGGLVKAGSGSLLISGDMSSFTGAITVGEGCGSVTIPAGTGATAGADTKYATGDDGTVTYTHDDGSLAVPADETIVWLGNARIKGQVDIAGTLLLGAPKDVPDCTLAYDFGADSASFGTYFTNAGGELSDGAINGRAAKYSETFKVASISTHNVASSFAVVWPHSIPAYCRLFTCSDDRWSIVNHNTNGYWIRRALNWHDDFSTLWQNGEATRKIYTDSKVISVIGNWQRYSPDSVVCGSDYPMTWGEVVFFSREVTDDERIGIEDYLMWKWGFKSEYLPFTASNYVTMTAGSTLDLGGFDLTVSSFYGCGTVENGILRTADSFYWQGEGALTIPAVDGATYVASSSRYVLTITGAVGKNVTIRFPADWHDENDGKYTPVYCDGTPSFVFEGTEVPLFSDGAGGWCIASTDTGSYGENTEDDADEDGFEDEDGTAFPGAQGWGRFAKGARASSSPTVYHVTNLNDSGAGSLRDAVSQPNRIVVFDVGGLIKINSRITFASNLYVAGQTAPGEGITVYGDGCSFSGASNMICRYLRWRMGHGGSSGKDCAGIANGANMIFDHCSFSWGLDETFSVNPDGKGTSPSNITLQNCIFGQGLMTHSAGGLMQGDYITLWRNLYVDNSTRNNKVKGINHYANNIVYNWKNGCYIMGGDSSGSSYCIIEGNLFINGPVSSSSNALGGGNSDFHFYGADNWQDFNRDGKLDATCIDDSQTGGGDKVSTRYDYPVVPLYAGYELLEKNLRKVGASLPYRDPNDCYMIDEVESIGKSGGLITYESSLAIGAPDSWTWYEGAKKTDSDGDGIPDSWEEANGLDKANASDALWKASNGRLNIENYINSITAEDREFYLRPPFTLGAVSDTTTTIKLTWRDYTYGEIGFLVEKKVNGDWQTVYRCQPNTNYYRVTGLTPGTYYNLRVRAVGLENGSYVYSDPAEIYINTRSAPQTEVDIDTYEPDLHLAEGQSYWDGTHRYWVERTMFADGNKVLLDTETTQKVNIQSLVKPESIVVNGTGDLTLNKVGNIGEYEGSTGTLTSINKGNTGSLYLIGAGSYLGKIINHEGTIWFNSIADGGTASSLGASPNDAQYWVFDGGSYIYNGSSASSNRNLEFRRTSGLGVSGSSTTLTLSGAIEGDGDFVQVGDGTIDIANANTFFGSKKRGVRLEGGTLYLSSTGDSGSARNFANGNTVTNIVLAGGHVMFRSASEEYQTYSVPIQVEEGTSSQISLATHCYLKSRITGTGDLTLNIPYVRCFIDKDTKINAFEGNITANGTASGATFYHEGYWNCPNTRFNLTGTIGMVSKNRHVTCYLGGLSGDSGTELMGSDTKSSGSGTLWIVGSANSDETFAGTINDYNADHSGTGTTSIRKVGTGYWRLTGSSTLTGTTEVNEGTLIVDGTLPATSAVTVNSGGTLTGYGTINGSITVNDGGVLTSGDDALYGQYLCPKGNVTLLSGSTLKMPLFWSSTKGAKSSNFRPSTSATWKISTTATLELNVGNIEKFRVSANDKYYVFDSRYLPKFSGEFTKISPEQPEKGYLWDLSHLYTDGYVMIVADPDYTAPTRDFNPLKWKTGLSYHEAQTLLAGGYSGSVYVQPENYSFQTVDDRNRYTALFDFVTYGPDEKNEYYIVPELSEEGEAAIKDSAETILTAASGSLASIASASGETPLNFSTDPIPGVYYSIKSGSSPTSLAEGTKKQAGRGGAITLSFPHYDGSGFYSIAADLFNN